MIYCWAKAHSNSPELSSHQNSQLRQQKTYLLERWYDGCWTSPYLEFALGLPIIIVLQSTLLFHSLYHEHKYCRNREYQQISLQSRILYVVQQLVGLYWCLLNLIRYVRLQTSVHCFEAYSSRIVPFVYYGIYLYQILLRLYASFKGSYLELSRCQLYTLGGFAFIPVIIALIIILTSSAPWTPTDIKSDNLELCTLALPVLDYPMEMDLPGGLLVIGYIVWIPMMNMVFGVIFSIKLNKLLSKNKHNEDIKLQFKSLIIKHAILTLIGFVSSIINYVLLLVVGSKLFVLLDVFINCLVIGLMFKYNDKWYKRYCKCFIFLCFIDCCQCKRKMEDAEILEYMKGEINLNLSATEKDQSDHGRSVKVEDMSSYVSDNEHMVSVVNDSYNDNGHGQ